MRHEPSFLKDILSACRKIESIVAATTEASFLRDEVLPAAVLHHLTVIAEAVGRLSVELRDRHPEAPWRQIIAVRHRIVQAYFDLVSQQIQVLEVASVLPGAPTRSNLSARWASSGAVMNLLPSALRPHG